MTLQEARQIAFNIVAGNGDCLKDDYPLEDFIDDIALALMKTMGAKRSGSSTLYEAARSVMRAWERAHIGNEPMIDALVALREALIVLHEHAPCDNVQGDSHELHRS